MSDNTQSVGSTLPRGAHSHVYSLPRGAWECCRDAPRPCRQVGALSRRCIRCRRTIGLSLDAERRVYTPTRSALPRVLAPTLRVGVSSGRSASLPPGRCAQPAVYSVPAHDRGVARRRVLFPTLSRHGFLRFAHLTSAEFSALRHRLRGGGRVRSRPIGDIGATNNGGGNATQSGHRESRPVHL